MKLLVMRIERIKEVDAVRLAANYLVVVMHSVCIFQYMTPAEKESEILRFFSQVLAPIAMPTLFFISGYVLFVSSDNYVSKMRKRIGRLLIPYLCWNLIFVLGFWVSCWFGLRNGCKQDFSDIWFFLGWFRQKLFSLCAPPADMPTWYLRAVFIYALASPLIEIVLRGRCRAIRLAVMVVLILFAMWCVSSFGLESDFVYTYPIYSMLSFALGAWFSIAKIQLSILWDRRWLIFLCLGLMSFLVLRLTNMPRYLVPVFQAGQFLLLFAIARVALLPLYKKLPDVMRDSAFFVYLCHIAVLPLIARSIAFCINGIPLGCSIAFVVSVIVSIGICMCIYMITLRLCPILSNALNGRLRI